MDNDGDFTFAQVSPTVNQDKFEAANLASDIDGIAITDKSATNRSNGPLWKSLSNTTSTKQETVGSLSFSVIDSSSSKQSSEISSKEASLRDAKQTISERKPATRTKVPFEKGYSQMDWMKLTRTHPDLAGLNGKSNKRIISMDEVKQNRTGDAMWTVLKGRVYNIAPYMKFHPGGVDLLMKGVGKDCTSLFNKYHAWVNAEFLLEKCIVGVLDDGK